MRYVVTDSFELVLIWTLHSHWMVNVRRENKNQEKKLLRMATDTGQINLWCYHFRSFNCAQMVHGFILCFQMKWIAGIDRDILNTNRLATCFHMGLDRQSFEFVLKQLQFTMIWLIAHFVYQFVFHF